jgi:hypothetical protein
MTSTLTRTSTPSDACPFAGKQALGPHAFCPGQASDSRSPCPAINTLANHGYISRDGRAISTRELLCAVQQVYGLSWPLALFLVIVGLFVLHHWNLFRPIDLNELRVHNRVEHNASLVHDDVALGQDEAPTAVNPGLVDQLFSNLISNSTSSDNRSSASLPTEKSRGEYPLSGNAAASPQIQTMDYNDVALARVRRQAVSGEIDAVHQEIARGEMAIILGAWSVRKLGLMKNSCNGKDGAPASWLREWLSIERLPDEWFDRVESGNTKKTGLLETVKMSRSIKLAMDGLQANEKI